MSVAEQVAHPAVEMSGETGARVLCGLAAVAAVVPFTLSSLSGESGAAITRSLVADSVSLQVGTGIAAVVSAVLVLAAVRLGRRVPGAAGTVMLASGVAVAVLYAAYYAAFGAGAVVADVVLTEAGPGVGEGTVLLVNLAELTRYAPGLALVGAAVAARRLLPGGLWIAAAALALMTVFPLTTWVAALLVPLWLAVAGTLRSPQVRSHPA